MDDREQDVPSDPKPRPRSKVLIVVAGTPRRATVTLSSAQRSYRTTTSAADGRGFMPDVVPGFYSCVTQRGGKAPGKPERVLISEGRVLLAIGARV